MGTALPGQRSPLLQPQAPGFAGRAGWHEDRTCGPQRGICRHWAPSTPNRRHCPWCPCGSGARGGGEAHGYSGVPISAEPPGLRTEEWDSRGWEASPHPPPQVLSPARHLPGAHRAQSGVRGRMWAPPGAAQAGGGARSGGRGPEYLQSDPTQKLGGLPVGTQGLRELNSGQPFSPGDRRSLVA